jgi:hypothetical protein
MGGFRYRLIDTAGSELMIVTYPVPNVKPEGELQSYGGRSLSESRGAHGR